MINQIRRIFLNTDMRCQHAGLSALALAENVDLEKLEPGEHVIFLNRTKTRCKMFSRRGIIHYLWNKDGPIDPVSLQFIPQSFNEKGRVSLEKALQRRLCEKVQKPTKAK